MDRPLDLETYFHGLSPSSSSPSHCQAESPPVIACVTSLPLDYSHRASVIVASLITFLLARCLLPCHCSEPPPSSSLLAIFPITDSPSMWHCHLSPSCFHTAHNRCYHRLPILTLSWSTITIASTSLSQITAILLFITDHHPHHNHLFITPIIDIPIPSHLWPYHLFISHLLPITATLRRRHLHLPHHSPKTSPLFMLGLWPFDGSQATQISDPPWPQCLIQWLKCMPTNEGIFSFNFAQFKAWESILGVRFEG